MRLGLTLIRPRDAVDWKFVARGRLSELVCSDDRCSCCREQPQFRRRGACGANRDSRCKPPAGLGGCESRGRSGKHDYIYRPWAVSAGRVNLSGSNSLMVMGVT